MNDLAEKAGAVPPPFEKQLFHDWGQMKQRYPMVRSMDRAQGDEVKEEFLRSIDGLKSAEEIAAYFTLESGEAYLIFSDLLRLGAIRFLEDSERFGYLRKQNLELKQKFDIQMTERSRCIGEERYLSERLKEKKKALAELSAGIPELDKSLQEQDRTLTDLRRKYHELGASNSELLSLSNEMKSKEQQIRQAIETLEAEFPKLLKKKLRVLESLKKIEEAQNLYADGNDHLDKKLLVYRDTVDEMRDYLQEAKSRVAQLVKDK